jgi:hypothetical protein
MVNTLICLLDKMRLGTGEFKGAKALAGVKIS